MLSLSKKILYLIGGYEFLFENVGTGTTVLIHTDAFNDSLLIFPVTAECCDRFLCHCILVLIVTI